MAFGDNDREIKGSIGDGGGATHTRSDANQLADAYRRWAEEEQVPTNDILNLDDLHNINILEPELKDRIEQGK